LVTVRAPGAITPIDILTTHLNCRHHSGVSDARSLYAYRRQVDFLTAFINAAHDPAIPLIAAGDFNDGRSQSRGLALRAEVPQWHGAEPFHEALSQFVNDERLRGMAVQADVDAVLHHGADWQFFTSGLHSSLQLVGITVPFGPDATGKMLSDHIGYVAQFRLRRA
jgi:endonuclease/exonuclease/phosphatase family metal-dependent hydrolase